MELWANSLVLPTKCCVGRERIVDKSNVKGHGVVLGTMGSGWGGGGGRWTPKDRGPPFHFLLLWKTLARPVNTQNKREAHNLLGHALMWVERNDKWTSSSHLLWMWMKKSHSQRVPKTVMFAVARHRKGSCKTLRRRGKEEGGWSQRLWALHLLAAVNISYCLVHFQPLQSKFLCFSQWLVIRHRTGWQTWQTDHSLLSFLLLPPFTHSRTPPFDFLYSFPPFPFSVSDA
jgi:hypothetical protein